MEDGVTTPIVHTGPISTSKMGDRLRYPVYPQVVDMLLGENMQSHTNRVDISLLKLIAFKHYWKNGYEPKPLFGVTYEKDFSYNDEILYSDYFRNLKITEGTGLSLQGFLDLPFDLASDILDKEITRAEKEIKEEKDRKAKQEAEVKRKELQARFKNKR